MSRKILKTIHESVKSLYDLDIVDKTTMHEFDLLCLEPIKQMKPREVKKLRLREHVSQPVFAMLLNVSPSSIKKWESGENAPSGAALRLLEIIDKNGLGIISGGTSLQSENRI